MLSLINQIQTNMKTNYFFCLFLLGVVLITKAQNNKAINQIKINKTSTYTEYKDLYENLKKVKDENVINSNDTEFKCNTIHHKEKLLSNYIDTLICELWDYDKLEWVNSSMEITHYNSNGDIDKNVVSYWENNTWGNYKKRLISYYSNNLIKEEKYYSWKSTKWENSGYDYYEYDNVNNLVLHIDKWEWDKSMNDWQVVIKDSVIYNADNLIAEHYSVFYDCCNGWGTSTTLDFDRKLTYTYNSNQALIQETNFLFNKNNNINWYPTYQLIYQYDSLNNLNIESQYYWVDTNNQWGLYSSTLYFYDTNNYLVNNVTDKYDSSSYIYTNNYLSTAHQYYSWNKNDSSWSYLYETKVEKDINGNKLLYYYFNYSNNFGSKDVMTYDSDDNLIEYMFIGWDYYFSSWDTVHWQSYKYTMSDYWRYSLSNKGGAWDTVGKCHGTYYLNTITNI